MRVGREWWEIDGYQIGEKYRKREIKTPREEKRGMKEREYDGDIN